ncbi:MAG: YbcC family protein [Marinobacter sp.]
MNGLAQCSAANGIVDQWQASLTNACHMIAPVWPLDQWIAVNPFWGLRNVQAPHADNLLRHRRSESMLMPAAFYREAWEGGRISRDDLLASLKESQISDAPEFYCERLYRSERPVTPPGYSLLDILPAAKEGEQPMVAVVDQIGRTCGAFFDKRQSRWSTRSGEESLFDFWLKSVRTDVALDFRTGIRGVRTWFKALPENRLEATSQAIGALAVDPDTLEALCHGLLMRIPGWAGWCRGVDWRAGLKGKNSGVCEELVSVLLIWEWAALAHARAEQINIAGSRREALVKHSPEAEPDWLWVWQRAFEIGYLRSLWQALGNNEATQPSDGIAAERPDVQAVFCIDVRSEIIRRHLEEAHPGIQTIGFAGFFGLPIVHHKHGPYRPMEKLPGILGPAYRVVDTLGSNDSDAALSKALDQREKTRESVRKAKYGSLSTFTLVETTGLAWAWKLVKDSLNLSAGKTRSGKQSQAEARLVYLHGGDPLFETTKVELVAGFLRGMSLTHNFAPLLVFTGHGTHTENNPHNAGLACGACGGQNGGLNARLAAQLFNDPQVRVALAEEGISIPGDSWAVAAEHCTVTDEVSLFDSPKLPASHAPFLADLERGFAEAGKKTRRERATALKLNGFGDNDLLQKVKSRTSDWTEVRPEWGLANNAAIIFAKRARTRARNLGGRVFLHDYDPEQDQNGDILAALLSAPMIVANWINMQYFGSVTMLDVFGAGNKLLHSVVGGNVGVIEGNGTDLRIGLPLQSVHDGAYWRHEPVRLTVLVDAPAERIEAAVRKNPDVEALVDNQWVWLYRLTDQGRALYSKGHWQPC